MHTYIQARLRRGSTFRLSPPPEPVPGEETILPDMRTQSPVSYSDKVIYVCMYMCMYVCMYVCMYAP